MPHRTAGGVEMLASALLAVGSFLVGIFGMLYVLSRQELPPDVASDTTEHLRGRMRRIGPALTALGVAALLTGLALRLAA